MECPLAPGLTGKLQALCNLTIFYEVLDAKLAAEHKGNESSPMLEGAVL